MQRFVDYALCLAFSVEIPPQWKCHLINLSSFTFFDKLFIPRLDV